MVVKVQLGNLQDVPTSDNSLQRHSMIISEQLCNDTALDVEVFRLDVTPTDLAVVKVVVEGYNQVLKDRLHVPDQPIAI